MKKVILTIALTLLATVSFAAETKKVCHDEIKNGKPSQVCKVIKMHKKLEGTNIQDTKPKK
jgi:hypothetical protein